MAVLAQGLRKVTVDLRRVRPRPHASRVRLRHADDRIVLVRREAEPADDAPDGGVGRGHKRVRAKVDVEHRGVGSLHEDPLAVGIGLIDVLDGVADKRLNPLRVALVVLDLRLDVVLDGGEPLEVVVGELPEGGLKRPRVLQHPDADTVPRCLGSIRRADPPLGCPNLLALKLRLAGAIDLLVDVEEEVRAIAYQEAPCHGDAGSLQLLDLLEQGRHVDDNAVADHAFGASVQDP
mmetsp:Transcript_33305/g.78985  ORF Transcript_33305/g.78985 Transcript_33305/m.78985 type:complete len:235 (-) Transcript_33305:501-1205(-)